MSSIYDPNPADMQRVLDEAARPHIEDEWDSGDVLSVYYGVHPYRVQVSTRVLNDDDLSDPLVTLWIDGTGYDVSEHYPNVVKESCVLEAMRRFRERLEAEAKP